MVNKKNNKLQKVEIEKEMLKEKKLLFQMKSEILDLEKQIRDAKLANKKNRTIKNLKIFTRCGKGMPLYVLVAGLAFGGVKAICGSLPLVRDEVKCYSHVMNEFDNRGNIRYEQQYKSFNAEYNTISLYSKWILQEDGLYSRNIKTFKIDKMSKDDILKIFDNLEESKSLEDLFGKPITDKKEYKYNLNLSEEENVDFLQAVTYDVDKEEFIIVREDIWENFKITVFYVMMTFLLELILMIVRSTSSSSDFLRDIDDIKQKYKEIDIESLTKKLEIKSDNYNRLLK